MKKVIVIALLLVVLFFPKKTFATLYINEFSSNSNPDWVEIYNSDSSAVDLTNYTLRDSTDSNKIDLTGTIQGNSFATFDWSDRLNNGGDTIRLLLKPDESSVDQIVYGGSGLSAPSGDQTAGRLTDGSSNWVILSSVSKGISNNSSTAVSTPTPTPSNTPTPTPTNSPTNTPTPTPTKAPTPTTGSSGTPAPTPTPKKGTPTPTPQVMTAQNTNTTQQVQGANTSKPSGSPVELGGQLDSLEAPKEPYNWWKLLIIMGTVIVTGACSLFMYNNYLKDRKTEESV